VPALDQLTVAELIAVEGLAMHRCAPDGKPALVLGYGNLPRGGRRPCGARARRGRARRHVKPCSPWSSDWRSAHA
jgi:hypothetical protein